MGRLKGTFFCEGEKQGASALVFILALRPLRLRFGGIGFKSWGSGFRV